MIHDRPRRMRTLGPFFALAGLILLAAPALAGEGRWTWSLSAAGSGRYEYQVDEFAFGSYPSRFDPGISMGAAGTRALTRHTSLVFEGGYRGYRRYLGLAGIPELPPTTSRLRAEFFSLGAGLRIRPFSGSVRLSGLYAQIVPALYVSRWEERTVDFEGQDLLHGTWRMRSTYDDSFRSALPGVAASVGYRGRVSDVVGTDFALRLTRSADLGQKSLGRFSSGDFHGLDELALVAGIAWSP